MTLFVSRTRLQTLSNFLSHRPSNQTSLRECFSVFAVDDRMSSPVFSMTISSSLTRFTPLHVSRNGKVLILVLMLMITFLHVYNSTSVSHSSTKICAFLLDPTVFVRLTALFLRYLLGFSFHPACLIPNTVIIHLGTSSTVNTREERVQPKVVKLEPGS